MIIDISDRYESPSLDHNLDFVDETLRLRVDNYAREQNFFKYKYEISEVIVIIDENNISRRIVYLVCSDWLVKSFEIFLMR